MPKGGNIPHAFHNDHNRDFRAPTSTKSKQQQLKHKKPQQQSSKKHQEKCIESKENQHKDIDHTGQKIQSLR